MMTDLETSPAPGEALRQTGTASFKVYRRLLGYLRPYWLAFSLSVLGFVLYAASQPAIAQFMEYLIVFIEAIDPGPVILPSLAIIAIVAVRSLGAFLGSYFLSLVSFRMVHVLRTEVFHHMTHLPGAYFDRHSGGHMMSVIVYNVNGVTTAATNALKILVREGTTIIALLAYLFYKDWQLTLLLLAVTPVIAGLVTYVGQRLRRLSARVQHTMGDITQVASEMIHGYRVMRSFGGEGYEKRRFDESSWNNYRQNMKIVLTASLSTPVIQMLVALSLGLLLFVALSLMDFSAPGAFVAYFVAAGMVLKPLRQLSDVIPNIQKGVAAADSIFQLLDEPGEPDQGDYRVDRVSGQVDFQGVSFRYSDNEDEIWVLKDIDLSVSPGEVIALVGRSGSGKSTLVSLLGRFYEPTQGRILLDSVALQEYALDNLRVQIALVSQNVVLFNDTVAGNIAYGALVNRDMEAIKAAARAAHADEFIEQLPQGYHTLIGESGTRLSGGQRQRLAIARALLKDAPVLILDEATSALDTESERYIQAALEEVMRGRTTFVVAHRLSTIERADRIAVMDEGRIVEVGSHRELLAADGHYARLHAMQFRED